MLTIREIRDVLLLVAAWNVVIIMLVCTSKGTTMVNKTIETAMVETAFAESEEIETEKSVNKNANTLSGKRANDMDSSMTSMYASLLIGDYSLGDGIKYRFFSDGSFSGYFDDEHTNVDGYYYEVVLIGGNDVVNIYNKDKTAVVSYYIMLSEEADIVLYYPEADIRFTLEC